MGKAWANSGLYGAPLSVSVNGTFSPSNMGEKVRASGTITRTLPAISSVFPGWATGEVENAGTGIVTIAAGAGDALEGGAAGTLALFPKQRAYFYLDTDGWHVGWADRQPLVGVKTVTSAVPNVQLPLPVGYGVFEYIIGGMLVDTNGVALGVRFSFDNAATYKIGATDYFYQFFQSYGANVAAYGSNQTTFIELLNNIANGSGGIQCKGVIGPGNPGYCPYIDVTAGWIRVDGNYMRISTGRYQTSGQTANYIAFFASSGNITGGTFAIRGIPSN